MLIVFEKWMIIGFPDALPTNISFSYTSIYSGLDGILREVHLHWINLVSDGHNYFYRIFL